MIVIKKGRGGGRERGRMRKEKIKGDRERDRETYTTTLKLIGWFPEDPPFTQNSTPLYCERTRAPTCRKYMAE